MIWAWVHSSANFYFGLTIPFKEEHLKTPHFLNRTIQISKINRVDTRNPQNLQFLLTDYISVYPEHLICLSSTALSKGIWSKLRTSKYADCSQYLRVAAMLAWHPAVVRQNTSSSKDFGCVRKLKLAGFASCIWKHEGTKDCTMFTQHPVY